MTESNFAPAAAPEEGSANRRNLLLLGGLAAVVLAGGGYYLLAGSGSSSTPTGTTALPQRPTVQVTPSKAPTPKASTAPKAAVVPAVSVVPIGRDPFRALYVVPAVNTAAVGTAPAAGTAAPVGTAPAAAAPAPTSYKLVLTSVGTGGKSAVFNIGGKIMTAQPGSVFGPTAELKLLSLTQDAKGAWVATLQMGDSSPLDAQLGKAVYVQ
jgi:hypothetical protein